MKLVLRISFALGFLMMVSTAAVAQDAPVLDEQNLRTAVADRINLLLTDQSQIAIQPVTPGDIKVEKVQQVTVEGITLFAVKLTMMPRPGQGMAEPDEMILLTDPSGTVQFGMVTDIRTGNDVAMVQAAELTRISFPNNLAKPLLTGQGDKNVIFVSDPFCPYCRTAYAYLMTKLANISMLSLVHMPLPMHPGADAAAWIMEFAREEAADYYQAAVDFAYGALQAPQTGTVENAQKNVIEQFIKRFPSMTAQALEPFYYYLKGKYEAKDIAVRRELQKLRISGTPVLIIDGQAIHGFDQKEIELQIQNKK